MTEYEKAKPCPICSAENQREMMHSGDGVYWVMCGAHSAEWGEGECEGWSVVEQAKKLGGYLDT